MEREQKDTLSKKWERHVQEKDNRLKRRDEEYKRMLEKLFSLKRENKELEKEEKSSSPSRLEVGRTEKGQTCWSNFTDFSCWLNRTPQHISEYFNKELGACGVIKNSRLTLGKGLSEALITSSLNNYISRYVVCNSCCSFQTDLVKLAKQRILEVKCGHCGSTRAVRTIKQSKFNVPVN